MVGWAQFPGAEEGHHSPPAESEHSGTQIHKSRDSLESALIAFHFNWVWLLVINVDIYFTTNINNLTLENQYHLLKRALTCIQILALPLTNRALPLLFQIIYR